MHDEAGKCMANMSAPPTVVAESLAFTKPLFFVRLGLDSRAATVLGQTEFRCCRSPFDCVHVTLVCHISITYTSFANRQPIHRTQPSATAPIALPHHFLSSKRQGVDFIYHCTSLIRRFARVGYHGTKAFAPVRRSVEPREASSDYKSDSVHPCAQFLESDESTATATYSRLHLSFKPPTAYLPIHQPSTQHPTLPQLALLYQTQRWFVDIIYHRTPLNRKLARVDYHGTAAFAPVRRSVDPRGAASDHKSDSVHPFAVQ
jgi:hypothetical protein